MFFSGKIHKISVSYVKCCKVFLVLFCFAFANLGFAEKAPDKNDAKADKEAKADNSGDDKSSSVESSDVIESEIGNQSIFSRAFQSGFIVFSVLLILVFLSIITWAVVIAKFIHLTKIDKEGAVFVKNFWDSRSLNDLNGRLSDYAYSPVREVFRSGYAELVRGSQLREQAGAANALAVKAAVENLSRSLVKAKFFEKRRMEKFLQVLAISASASPFIGLFGTVWGIMTSFEGIAKTGSASLAAVAPGISEALIATAFGLAAAIPAVIGYNISASKIRSLLTQIDGFIADFLNIVERYLVTDRAKIHTPASSMQADKM